MLELRALEGDFVLALGERSVSVRWPTEVAPDFAWKAAPLVTALAQWGQGSRAHAYR